MEFTPHIQILFHSLVAILLLTENYVSAYPRHRRRRFTEGSVRLVGGRNVNDGTVLIYHDERWGAICDRDWDIQDATVVCRQLGFMGGATRAEKRSKYGRGRRKYRA